MIRLRTVATLGLIVAVASCSDSSTAPVTEEGAPTADAPRGIPAGPARSGTTASTEAELRDALAAAAASPRLRVIQLGGDIELTSPLVYRSSLPLAIEGRGYRITGPEVAIDRPTTPDERIGEPSEGDALVVLGAPHLRLRDLTIERSSGHGIYMELPPEANGMVRVALEGTHLISNGLSGLWIEDQVGASGPIESPAGISLHFEESTATGNGFAGNGEAFADFDAIRVNEGGRGSIRFRAEGSALDENAGEGVELDEIGDGDVRARVEGSTFDRNGAQPQFPDDLEDGFDIDEAGAGSAFVVMAKVSANDSFDEGIDLDEEGPGHIVLHLEDVEAMRNNDENIKLTEDEDELAGGSIRVRFIRVTATDGSDDGIQLEEFGPGHLRGIIAESVVTRNGDDGLDLTQENEGTGLILLKESEISGNSDDEINADGVTVREISQEADPT